MSVYVTCEFLAEWRCYGGGFDQRGLADVFQILDLRHAVMVDKVIVFFGCGEGSVDLVTQVLNADILVVMRRHCLHQLCCVLESKGEKNGFMNKFCDLNEEIQGMYVNLKYLSSF